MGVSTSNPRLLVVGCRDSGKSSLITSLRSLEWEFVEIGCNGFSEMDLMRPLVRNEIESKTITGIIITINPMELLPERINVGKAILSEISIQQNCPPVLVVVTKTDTLTDSNHQHSYLKFSFLPSVNSPFVELSSLQIRTKKCGICVPSSVYNPGGSHRETVSTLAKNDVKNEKKIIWKDSNLKPVIILEFDTPLKDFEFQMSGTEGGCFPGFVKVEGSVDGRLWALVSEVQHQSDDPFLEGTCRSLIAIDEVMNTYKVESLLKNNRWVLQVCSTTTHQGLHQIKNWISSLSDPLYKMGGSAIWKKPAEAAKLKLTFLDLCSIHPKLSEYYEREDMRADAAAAKILFIDYSEEATSLKVGVYREWNKLGLLCAKGVPWELVGEPVRHHVVKYTAEKIKYQRQDAIKEMYRIREEEKKIETEKEAARIQQRRREGLQRDFGSGQVVSGQVVMIDVEIGKGEILIPGRNTNAHFDLEWIEYGLKRISISDRVKCTLVPSKRSREEVVGVRPEIDRVLSASDISAFCNLCRVSIKPEEVITRILVSLPDWHTLLKYLDTRPTTVGGSDGPSWQDCVSSIIELCSFPRLLEPRYRSVLQKFYQQCQHTPLPYLVKEICKTVSDEVDIVRGVDIAVFTEKLRNFSHKTGRPSDMPENYYSSIVALLERLHKAYTALESQSVIDKKKADKLQTIISRITTVTVDHSSFPTFEWFNEDPSCVAHPMNPKHMYLTTKLPWKTVDQYVGTHFSLLKGEMFSTSVKSILYHSEGGYEPEHPSEIRDMKMATTQYSGIKYVAEAIGDRGIWLLLSFNKPKDFIPFKCFKRDVLVCITNGKPWEGENKMWWGRVPFSDETMIDKGLVPIEIIEGDASSMVRFLQRNESEDNTSQSVMYETRVFGGMKPVLEALDNLRKEDRLPFNETLLRGAYDPEIKVTPEYIPKCYKKSFENIVRRMLSQYTFEPGQEQALRWLPFRPVLLVQGPPGTGKSFIGCRLVECIAEFRIKMLNDALKNEYAIPETDEQIDEVAEKPGPIIVLTFKNHSLDEFLIDCLDCGVWCGDLRNPSKCPCKTGSVSKFCCQECCDRQGHAKKLVRCGQRGTEPRLLKYNVNSLRQQMKFGAIKGKLKSLRTKIEDIAEAIKKLDRGVIDDSTISEFMTPEQKTCLLRDETVAPVQDGVETTLEKKYHEWMPSHPVKEQPEMREIHKLAKPYVNMADHDDINSAFLKSSGLTTELRAKCDKMIREKQNKEELGYDMSEDLRKLVSLEPDSSEPGQEGIRYLRSSRAFYRSICGVTPPYQTKRRVRDDDLDVSETAEDCPQILRTGEYIQPEFADVNEVWHLTSPQRKELVQYWTAKQRIKLVDKYKTAMHEFEGMLLYDQHMFDESHLKTLQQADIIGMTTTGAAMFQEILKAVKPSVLVVEEAAEILESQILSCFVESIKQVILIGDHKQLKPQVQVENYAKYNNMDISLFQRFIETCKVPCCKLTEQRRMRSSICDIVRPIYGELTDFHTLTTRTMHWGGKRVLQLPNLPGDAMFWTHNHAEQESGLSIKNLKEIEMVVFLCRYLIGRHGLTQDQVTVLTPYLGQCRELSAGVHVEFPEVECLTVDRFQGDENDIVIISLARTQRLTSFMKLENRMCVACSRARFGFFMIGCAELLEGAEHWKRTLDVIRKDNPDCVTKQLTLTRPGGEQTLVVNSKQTLPDPRLDSTWENGQSMDEEMEDQTEE